MESDCGDVLCGILTAKVVSEDSLGQNTHRGWSHVRLLESWFQAFIIIILIIIIIIIFLF